MRRPFHPFALVAGSILLACTLAAPALAASSSPTALQASIAAAVRAQHSVRITQVARTTGALAKLYDKVTVMTDAGATQGARQYSFQQGKTSKSLAVLVLADADYVRASSATLLINSLGFRVAASIKYAGVWIAIPRANRAYATVANGVTLASAYDELSLPSPSLGPERTVDGRRVRTLSTDTTQNGTVLNATLYAQATGPPLPVLEISTLQQGGAHVTGRLQSVATLTDWNAPLHVVAPPNAVPLAKTGLQAPAPRS